MKYINAKEWIPADGLTLEPNAIETVKSDYNALVVAGPGAGKTELLAQRACFLLETNSCIYPRRILAISFKRDAAFNLKERVYKRCGKELGQRFDSMTFDAFAKMILDRFYRGLPQEYQPQPDYNIFFNERDIIDAHRLIDEDYSNQVNVLKLFHSKLPFLNDDIHKQVFMQYLKGANGSSLTFKMIMRLAEFIMDTNEKLRFFLGQTYSHVFLDEFQDTTFLQYEFLNSCFGNSNIITTAVGDDKQRIMMWAGANPAIFDKYVNDYRAKQLALKMNFRSAPRLVKLQNYLIENLLKKHDTVISNPNWAGKEGEAYLYVFADYKQEMKILHSEINKYIEKDNLNPRDICILVKQQLNNYAGDLISYFNAKGIPARDESEFQDLLTENIVLFLTNVLYVVSDRKAQQAKSDALNFISNINSSIEDTQIYNEEIKFNNLVRKLKKTLKDNPLDEIDNVMNTIIEFVNIDKIAFIYPNYKNRNYLDGLVNTFSTELKKNLVNNTLKQSLDNLMGIGVIPVMTIHKSKGLEYNTVVFVGLEDNAFWSYSRQPDEDQCAFFVALSRAKERVIFTFSKMRKSRGQNASQKIDKIKDLLVNLSNSKIVKFEDKSKINEN